MNQSAHFQEAISAARSGMSDLARFHCQQAAQEHPDDPEVWLLLAWLAPTPAAMAECLLKCVSSETYSDTAQAGLSFAQSLCGTLGAGSVVPDTGSVSQESGDSTAGSSPDAVETDDEDKTVDAASDVTEDSAVETAATTSFVLVKEDAAEESSADEESDESTDNSSAPVIDLDEKKADQQKQDSAEVVAVSETPEEEPEPEAVEANQAKWMSESLVESDETPDDGEPVPTILVVDDSPTVRKMAQMTLEARGFKVVTAFDGVAAIKEISRHEPWLILLDINMPRLDGYQLCSLVRKHKRTQHIPVVMLSGKDGMFDKLRGKMAGCSTYMTKPFIPEKLVEVVDKYIGQAACAN